MIWKYNKKAWTIKVLFKHWIISYFSPFIKIFCESQHLPNKALLIVDNAPGRSIDNEDLASNIQVIFLPPNNTSLLQPMDQALIATFKA